MKGSSSKAKKLKRKKDEFHSHKKLHIQETGLPDLEQVKARTMLAFDRLGHQVLSSEPGGYDLQSWMKSFNSLLDDFAEKVGPGRLPTGFDDRRREISAALLVAPDSSDTDSEIAKLVQEQEVARKVVEDGARKAANRLNSLREERQKCEKDLKEETKKLADLNEEKQSRRFFSRVLRAGPPTAQSEATIKELESSLSKIAEEIERLQKLRAAITGGSPTDGSSELVDAQQRVESIQKKLDDLRLAKQGKRQFAQEREMAAKTMSDIVSQMQVGGSGTET
jgi:uncharacterized protein YhaN